MNQPESSVPGRSAPSVVPGSADGERLLHGVERDLDLLDELDPQDQVPVFDRLHTSLADALARTADTGGHPPQVPGITPSHGKPQARPGA